MIKFNKQARGKKKLDKPAINKGKYIQPPVSPEKKEDTPIQRWQCQKQTKDVDEVPKRYFGLTNGDKPVHGALIGWP